MVKNLGAPDDLICGEIKRWRHSDLPDALRRVADRLTVKENNPHGEPYDHEDLGQAIKLLEEETSISISHVYVIIKPKKINYNPHPDWVMDLMYRGI
jgi:Mn-dependent DtxR family transcriptional regulator